MEHNDKVAAGDVRCLYSQAVGGCLLELRGSENVVAPSDEGEAS